MELSEEQYQVEVENEERCVIAIEIECMLFRAPPLPLPNECCIYKVPPRLCKLNPDAYTPKIVSIGPFHYRRNPQLDKMEDHKQHYCQNFIRKSKASLDDLVKRVKELEPRVRRCYSEKINLTVKEFIKVIFVDCCFTLEFLLRDTSSIAPWLEMDIEWDLMRIENQLPFFVYHEIYELAFKSAIQIGDQPSFMEVASYWLPFVTVDKGIVDSAPIDQISHFIDLNRHYCTSKGQSLRGYEFLTHFYSATTLKEAGVKFRVHKESKGSLELRFSGSCFKGGCLEIPQFMVEAGTEMLLRNIIAFELSHCATNPYFTQYIELIKFLINTEKDVDILVSNKIIINRLGDRKAVAKMVNGLCENVELRNSNINYLRIRHDLDAYFEHCWWHRRKESLREYLNTPWRTLRRDYCNTPWKTVASLTGIVVLLLTITQTVFSILQVV